MYLVLNLVSRKSHLRYLFVQNQIAEIYKSSQQNISFHINQIYKDKELDINSTNKKFLLVQSGGNRYFRELLQRESCLKSAKIFLA